MKFYFLIILIMLLSLNSLCQTQVYNQNNCLIDSICLDNFISTNDLCNKISFAEQNIIDIASEKGFYKMLLISISKDSQQKIFLTTINGNVISSKENISDNLKEQFDYIKLKFKCRL